LAGYFLTVIDVDKNDETEGTIFDNLWLEESRMGFTEVISKIMDLNIPCPLAIQERIYEHGRLRLGNVFEEMQL
jgi:hypothetical protein